MGTNGQLFPLTDNTDGAAVDQVQQRENWESSNGLFDCLNSFHPFKLW
jgi:hypothetical protein